MFIVHLFTYLFIYQSLNMYADLAILSLTLFLSLSLSLSRKQLFPRYTQTHVYIVSFDHFISLFALYVGYRIHTHTHTHTHTHPHTTNYNHTQLAYYTIEFKPILCLVYIR